MPQHRLTHRNSAAFTLMEVAVVLAVIGLLVGAVIGGTALLRQSELQTVTNDFGKYSAAVSQFRQQYGGLPGDIIDATNFWGDDSVNCADAGVTDGAPGTCNGNGNENMSDGTEAYRAWQHLAMAKLIVGNYTGLAGGATPGTNVPKSRITNSGWSFGFKGVTAADANLYNQDLSNFLSIGTPTGALTQGAAITPQDAWQVDTKIDDGSPSLGRVMTMKPASLANCSLNPGPADSNASYNRTFTAVACSLNMSLTLK